MLQPRRISLLVAALVGVLGSTVPVAFGSLSDRKAQVDSRIQSLEASISRAKHKEGVLSTDIENASSQIDALHGDIGVLEQKLATLEHDLAEHRARLEALKRRYEQQTRRLEQLVRQHRIAQKRLADRLLEIYESDQADEVAILLQAASIDDLLAQIDYFHAVADRDKEISDQIERLKIAVHDARIETGKTKAAVAKATAILAKKTAQQQAARDQLVAERDALVAARAGKQQLLASVESQQDEDEEDLASMQAASQALAAQIQAAQAAAAASSGGGSSGGGSSGGGGGGSGGDTTPSSSGLIWPVSGPVVSGFGYRCLGGICRMHEGIDIAVPNGTPVRAASSGTVIYAGAMSGYGNIVVVDHGGGLATAYAHLSAIYAGGGSVSQGQTIGASGCTGHCYGPHLHFEVRINGQAVNPFGYL